MIMKKHILYYTLAIAMVFGIYASANAVSAQVTGGYGDTSVADKDVKRAAAFAVRTRANQMHRVIKLVKIQKAEVQVVAGLNYRICVRVSDSRGRRSTITAVVYKNLKNRRSLSSWKSGGCTEL